MSDQHDKLKAMGDKLVEAMKGNDEVAATAQAMGLLIFGLHQLARIADACERWAKSFESDSHP